MNFTAINFYLIMCIFLFISAEKEDQMKADHLKLFTPRTRNIMVNILASTPTDSNILFIISVRCGYVFCHLNAQTL